MKLSPVAKSLCFCLLFCTSIFSTHGMAEPSLSLEGLSYSGSIKAKGIIGLVSVKGTLSFKDGYLKWQAKGNEDSGLYTLQPDEHGVTFKSLVVLDNHEKVIWTGHFDGEHLTQVSAVWHRSPGDAIHDLLLPDKVTLLFRPDMNHKK